MIIVLVNVAFVVFILAAILGLLGWGIAADRRDRRGAAPPSAPRRAGAMYRVRWRAPGFGRTARGAAPRSR